MYNQNREELLENFKKIRPTLVYDRKTKLNVISGTDIGAIMGYNPYQTVYDVWLKRKFGFVTPVENPFITGGIKLESVVANKFYMTTERKRKGYRLIKGGYTKEGYIVGTPDYILNNNKGLEIKTAHASWIECPKHYELQCRWYMHLNRFDFWDLAALIDGFDYREYSFERDMEIEKIMLDAAATFHNDHLIFNAEPFDIKVKQKSTQLIQNESIDLLSALRDSLKQSISDKEKDLKDCETSIKALIGDNEGIIGAKYKATWKEQSRASINYEKMIEDYNIDVEKYKESESTYRVLRIKRMVGLEGLEPSTK